MTHEELKDLMKANGIERMPIYYQGPADKGASFCGYVTSELKYDHHSCLRHFKVDSFALDLACEQIEDWISKVAVFRSPTVVTAAVEHHNVHNVWEYADDDGKVRHHTYPIKDDTVRMEEWHGTHDELFEKMYRENNRLRYCNGMYWIFSNLVTRQLYAQWKLYISESRSFDLYYGGGVVD